MEGQGAEDVEDGVIMEGQGVEDMEDGAITVEAQEVVVVQVMVVAGPRQGLPRQSWLRMHSNSFRQSGCNYGILMHLLPSFS